MDINSILSSQAAQTSSTSSPTSNQVSSELGKDDFLKILVAQLQNQDPTSPMDNSQFISQMAQFSALEQMQQLNTSFGYSQAYSLMGKSVTAEVTGSDGVPKSITGIVSGVKNIGNSPYICINGDYVSMSASLTVNDQGSEQMLLQGASMIGKYITGSYTDSDKVVHPVSGQVDKIAMVNGLPVLYVGTQAVNLADVTGVSATAPVPAPDPEPDPVPGP